MTSIEIVAKWLQLTIILLSLQQIQNIMSQSALTIRLDSDLKTQFDSLCEEFGMSTNTAFNIYVRQVVRNRSIPFTIEAPSKDDVMAKGRAAFYRMRQAAAEAGMQDLSLDEINEEIRLVREGK
jgi:DNA-damage-inducible protein J